MTVLLLLKSGFHLFPFLLWLLWLWLPKLCWIKVVRVDFLVLLLILGKCFQIFTTDNDVSCEFVIYDFYYVEVDTLCAHFLEYFFFIKNECWILSTAFSLSIEMIIWFLFFNLMWYITLIADIEKSLHPWDKSHLIMVFNILNVLLDLVCYNLLRTFACIFISDLCCGGR